MESVGVRGSIGSAGRVAGRGLGVSGLGAKVSVVGAKALGLKVSVVVPEVTVVGRDAFASWVGMKRVKRQIAQSKVSRVTMSVFLCL
jgi:hypothetical protein